MGKQPQQVNGLVGIVEDEDEIGFKKAQGGHHTPKRIRPKHASKNDNKRTKQLEVYATRIDELDI